jgi:hypothetical protein
MQDSFSLRVYFGKGKRSLITRYLLQPHIKLWGQNMDRDQSRHQHMHES